jgi:hypothetical protein
MMKAKRNNGRSSGPKSMSCAEVRAVGKQVTQSTNHLQHRDRTRLAMLIELPSKDERM